jgi:hypothetical protein
MKNQDDFAFIRFDSWPDYLTYQTRHSCWRTIFCPALHKNAYPNSGILLTTPLMRYSFGECGFVTALSRLLSGRSSPQAEPQGIIPGRHGT